MIQEAGTTLIFKYDAERARFKQENSASGVTMYYIGGLYEKQVQGNTVTHVHYLQAGGAPIAIYKAKGDASNTPIGTPTVSYLHRDHIGSIVAITGDGAALLEEASFDTWGKRRADFDWSDFNGQAPLLETLRGFTGHEMLDEVSLIHMNGRVYDADLGRFLSADPFIQQAGNLQSFNRYSYVLNNPLSATDPSGYFFGFFKKLFKAIGSAIKSVFRFIAKHIRTIVAIGVAAIPGVNVWAIAALGFASGMIASGGDLRAGIIGALSAAAFNIGNIAARIAVSAVIGGVGSVAQGGNFLSGFLSGGFSAGFGAWAGKFLQNAGYAGRLIASSIAGGIVAELGGGKFKNGAVTGALAYAVGSGVESLKRAREVPVPEDVNNAIEDTFESVYGGSVNVDQIRVIENSKWADFISDIKEFITGGRYWVPATTQRDTIYLNSRITADQLFSDPELLLHEYYHVVRQWNTGAMSNFSYLISPSTWEQPAINFGQSYKGTYQSYLGGP